MATLSLRISIPEKNATKMMQFDPSTSVYDACRIIREKLAEASNMGQRKYSTAESFILLKYFINAFYGVYIFLKISIYFLHGDIRFIPNFSQILLISSI